MSGQNGNQSGKNELRDRNGNLYWLHKNQDGVIDDVQTYEGYGTPVVGSQIPGGFEACQIADVETNSNEAVPNEVTVQLREGEDSTEDGVQEPQNQSSAMSDAAFFRAMLRGLLQAEEPELVIDLVWNHIHEYGHRRFLAGMDFQNEIALIPEEDWNDSLDEEPVETCER